MKLNVRILHETYFRSVCIVVNRGTWEKNDSSNGWKSQQLTHIRLLREIRSHHDNGLTYLRARVHYTLVKCSFGYEQHGCLQGHHHYLRLGPTCQVT